LNVVGQFSHDGVGWGTRVGFVIGRWWVSICLLLVKLVGVLVHVLLGRSVGGPFVGFVSVVDGSFVGRRWLLMSVERRLFWVGVPAFRSR